MELSIKIDIVVMNIICFLYIFYFIYEKNYFYSYNYNNEIFLFLQCKKLYLFNLNIFIFCIFYLILHFVYLFVKINLSINIKKIVFFVFFIWIILNDIVWIELYGNKKYCKEHSFVRRCFHFVFDFNLFIIKIFYKPYVNSRINRNQISRLVCILFMGMGLLTFGKFVYVM